MGAVISEQGAAAELTEVAACAQIQPRRRGVGKLVDGATAGHVTSRNRAQLSLTTRRNLRSRISLLPVGLIGSLVAPLVVARDFVSDDWQFSLTPYVWAISANGDATVKGVETDVDTSFSDVLENLNMAVMAVGEARKGRFGLFTNIIYADLEFDDTRRLLRIHTDAKALYLGVGAYYRLGPWNLSSEHGDAGPKLIVDPYVGGRYTYVDADLKLRTNGPRITGDLTPSASKDWFDPIVGVRTIWQFTPNVHLMALGDVGVFGDSDTSWQVAGLLGYRLGIFGGHDNGQVLVGYRALHQDYSDGSGRNKFKWDGTLKGPVIGLTINF